MKEKASATASSTVDEAVAAVFGAEEQRARRFVHHLTTTGVERGLLGPREVPRIWTRHVLNCAVVGELIGSGERVADIGAGAGLPGIALALARPDLSIFLVEPLLRRVTWLHEVVEDLHLEQVTVVRGRAQDVVGDVAVDVAVARAVAQLTVLARWSFPLLLPGGRLLAIKGRNAAEEMESSQETLTELGAERWEISRAGEQYLEEPTTVVEVVAGSSAGRRSRAAKGSERGARRNRRRRTS
jgi:16S rRNA (guanine527-N7)-methyltransferase